MIKCIDFCRHCGKRKVRQKGVLVNNAFICKAKNNQDLPNRIPYWCPFSFIKTALLAEVINLERKKLLDKSKWKF